MPNDTQQPPLRRMASIATLFRSKQPSQPEQPQTQPKRTAYVPTHAASSFARTAGCRTTTSALSSARSSSSLTTSGDYAAFVAHAEATDRARDQYRRFTAGFEGDTAAFPRQGKTVSRRMSEYFRPA